MQAVFLKAHIRVGDGLQGGNQGGRSGDGCRPGW